MSESLANSFADGYSTKGTTIYVKPGIGFAPEMNDRQWGIEFGARVQF